MGSEMCIRDRTDSLPTGPALPLPAMGKGYANRIDFVRQKAVFGLIGLALTLCWAPVANADPIPVCPFNQPSGWNGQQCFPQPCVPPYAPGVPPCFMPPPTIAPPTMAPGGIPH